eukprot:SAG25_NODE_14_length_24446_cov_22.033678_4_plen_163_part_00
MVVVKHTSLDRPSLRGRGASTTCCNPRHGVPATVAASASWCASIARGVCDRYELVLLERGKRRPARPAAAISYMQLQDPPPNHDCENMDMPAVVTPSVNVTGMACVGHVVYTIAFPQLCGLTPTFAWIYIHMSVTRWDVTPRNACLWPQALLQGRQHGYVHG